MSSERLTDRQRVVLSEIARYNNVTGEACPLSYVARRLNIHHSTARSHLEAIHRKGFVLGSSSPALAKITRKG